MLRWSAFAALLLLGPVAADPPPTKPHAPADAAAVIQVLHQGTPVRPSAPGTDQRAGRVDLGTAAVATVKPAVFTVRNAGTAVLTLAEPLRLPRGFTLVRSFATHTLAPGQSTSFVVALNSARAGQLSGPITFGTNGSTGGRFRFTVTGTALGPPSLRIIDDSDPDFRVVGPWAVVAGRGYQGTARGIAAGRGANRAVWTFTGLKPGLYQVSATWPAQDGQGTDARFTVLHGTKPCPPVLVDQSRKARDWHDAGTTWQHLGQPYRITGDRLVVWLSDQANGPVVADAVRIQRLGLPGRIVTAADPGFQATGRWEKSEPAAWQADGDPSSATWTFGGLVPGHYRISVTWPANRRGAAAAPFTVLDDGREVARVAVNQHWTPDDLRDAGRTWTDLGGRGQLFPIKGKRLVVRLFNPDGHRGAGQAVLAGAVRVERIYDPGGGGTAGPLISSADAVRFLEQSTWGPNDDLLSHFQNDLGADPQAFLDEQFSAPVSSYPTPPLVPDDQTSGCRQGDNPCVRDNYTLYPVQNRFFSNALYGPDQLRQRLAFALHEIDVVSGLTVGYPLRYVPYLQIFDRNAFGNYRDVLGEITLNPAMGTFQNTATSTRTNPNENYAREVMQLFSVGLNLLNPDGTLQLDGDGNPIPTYTQDTVTNFARVFTGWTYAAPPMVGVTNYLDPMIVRTPESTYHDRDPKTLLQYPGAVNPTLPANQAAQDDLNQALDNIFYHPNVGPFISKQLIQKLVTSNPSPGYVARVAAVFNDDGTGVRGNLWAVVQAVLLDPEARGDMPDDLNYGHVREPALYACNVLRAFNATSHDGRTTSDGYVNPQVVPLGMDIFRPATVFSYYPPSFNVPGNAAVLSPEFGIVNTVTTLKRANFVNTMTFGGGIPVSTNAPHGTALNLTALQAMTPDGMADYLNGLLLHGTMSDAMRTALIQAINAVAPSDTLKRARTAVYLVATSAQYQVER